MMKKLTVLILFLLSSILCKAPELNSIVLIVPEVIMDTRYDPLIEAITWHETKHGKDTINKDEQAYGWFQIRQIRLDDYNRLNHTNYTLTDCFDYNISKKIFLYYVDHDHQGHIIPNKTWEQAAKDWNGSGPKTKTYWKNIQFILKNPHIMT